MNFLTIVGGNALGFMQDSPLIEQPFDPILELFSCRRSGDVFDGQSSRDKFERLSDVVYGKAHITKTLS